MDKISKSTRWAKAGAQMADAIIETIHGLYLRDNALQYLNAMCEKLNRELRRRKVDWKENEPHRKAVRAARARRKKLERKG